MGIIPDEIFKIIAASEPMEMEPGMHGEITIKKPGSDFIEQITKIKEICDNIIEAYGCDECDTEGKDKKDELRKMRSTSKEQSEEDDGGEEELQEMRK